SLDPSGPSSPLLALQTYYGTVRLHEPRLLLSRMGLLSTCWEELKLHNPSGQITGSPYTPPAKRKTKSSITRLSPADLRVRNTHSISQVSAPSPLTLSSSRIRRYLSVLLSISLACVPTFLLAC